MNFLDPQRLMAVQTRLFVGVWRPSASFFLLFTFFWMVAAAGFSGSFQKHGMPDGALGGGIEVMLDASAKKPYVYRQLGPLVANFLDRTLPLTLQEAINAGAAPELIYTRAKSVVKPEFRFRYICIYYLSFLSLFASLFVFRKILLDYGLDQRTSTVAPAIFIIAYPYLQTGGGYYYDHVEIFFLALGFLAARRGQIALLLGVSLFATLNKESFFFFIPSLFPLLQNRLGRKQAMLTCFSAIFVSGIMNAALKIYFFKSPGSAVEFKLFHNILNYINPMTYFQLENTFGIVSPAGASFVIFLVAAIVVLRGWQTSPEEVRKHALLAACLNLPLFFAFCTAGELRNLSLLCVGFVVLGAYAMWHESNAWLDLGRARLAAASSGDPAMPLETPVKRLLDKRADVVS